MERNIVMKRQVVFGCDDPQEAFEVYKKKKKEEPEKHWNMAQTRMLSTPPKTTHTWVVYTFVED